MNGGKRWGRTQRNQGSRLKNCVNWFRRASLKKNNKTAPPYQQTIWKASAKKALTEHNELNQVSGVCQMSLELWLERDCYETKFELFGHTKNGLHLYSAFIQSAVRFMPLIHPFTHQRWLAATQGTNQLVRSNWGLGVSLKDTSTLPGWDRTSNPPTASNSSYLLSHIAPTICIMDGKRGMHTMRSTSYLLSTMEHSHWCFRHILAQNPVVVAK